MEKTSLPIAYYLNNGEPDKTGYQQMAFSAFYKAVTFHPNKSSVTLGPNAQINEKKTESVVPVLHDQIDGNDKSCVLESNNETISLSKDYQSKSVYSNVSLVSNIEAEQSTCSRTDNDLVNHDKEISIFESPEEKEEKLIRKRILNSLENICLSESHEKINIMRRDWMKRDEDTMTRLQEELNATKSILVEKMIDDFHEKQKLVEKLIKESHEIAKVEKPRKFLTPTTTKKEEHNIISNSALGKWGTPVSSKTKFPPVAFSIPKPSNPIDGSQLMKPKDPQLSEIPQQIPVNKITTVVTPVEPKTPITNLEVQRIGNTPNELKLEKEIVKPEKIMPSIQKPPEKVEDKKAQPVEDSSLMEEDIISEEKKQTQKTKEIDPEIERIQNVMKHYKKYKKIYTEASGILNQFLSDESLKKFRSDCQKAVNIPVNAISGVSAAHLTDKLNKITALLSGNPVLVNNKSFSANQHPLGIKYCTFLLAEKIVVGRESIVSVTHQRFSSLQSHFLPDRWIDMKLGFHVENILINLVPSPYFENRWSEGQNQKQSEDAVSVKYDSAFPIALVVLEVWKQFPDFGDLLIGAFHNKCPYLIPIYWIQEDGMSNQEHERLLGFKYVEGERENIDMFLKRQGGIVRLYFSIIISHMRNTANQCAHPLPLIEAWRWLAMFTGLEPSAEITATLLYDMLEVTGHTLLKTYGKQFLKLIHLVCVHFIPKIEKVTPKGKGGPVSRLKSFLEQLIRTHSVKPPKGVMPLNFW